jgi:hypothetical protein
MGSSETPTTVAAPCLSRSPLGGVPMYWRFDGHAMEETCGSGHPKLPSNVEYIYIYIYIHIYIYKYIYTYIYT